MSRQCANIYLAMIFLLLFVAPLHLVDADTLVRRGTLQVVDTDSTDLSSGGTLASTWVGNGCSTRTYYDACTGVTGTRIDTTAEQSGGPFYILNGDRVTYCGRFRRESNCQTCNSLGCTVTNPISYGGTTQTSEIVTSGSNENDVISSLSLLREVKNACAGVCTNPNDRNDLLFPLEPPSECTVGHGWVAVNDDYDNICVTQDTCEEIEIVEGCEDTATGSVAGLYQPLRNPSSVCNADSEVDLTRSIYTNTDGDDDSTYLYYDHTQDEWVLSAFCNDLGVSNGFFQAANEPHTGAEDTILCWDGGYGSSKSYDRTPFQIRCNKKGSDNGSVGWDATGSSFSSSGNGSAGIDADGFGAGGDSSGAIRVRDFNAKAVYFMVLVASSSLLAAWL